MNMGSQVIKEDEKKHFYKVVFMLVIPLALQNLINVGVSAADVVMLGKVGEISLSASSLAGQIQFIMVLFIFGITSGAAVLTAQYWGKRDIATIEKVLAISMGISIAIGALFTIGVQLFPEQIMRIYTNDEKVIEEGILYLRIISLSYIVVSITMVYLNIMRSVERVLISTLVYLISLITNVILNAILIFGLLGFEPMGIKGAAIATLIARIVELVIVLFYGRFMNKEISFRIKYFFSWDKLLAKDFFTYAIPVMINELLWGAGTSTIVAIVGHLGTAVVAANSVTQVIRQLATVVSFGVSGATAIIVGKAIGEGKIEEAKVYSKRLIKMTLVFGAAGAVLILALSGVITNFMTLSQEATSYLRFMMFVMSYFVIAQAYNTTLIVGVFRGGGDTKYGLILDAITLWGCSIFFGALAAFVFELPIPIVYIILLSDEIIKLPFTAKRHKSLKWINDVTR